MNTDTTNSRSLSIDDRLPLGFTQTGETATASFDMPEVKALYIATNKVLAGGGSDTDRMTLLPVVSPPEPVACGDHKCTLTGSLTINIGVGAVGPFAINGALDLLGGTVDANGKCLIDAPFQFVDPIVIGVIGTVCLDLLPAGSCPLGEVDCDGGNDLDIVTLADHNIGSCTGNASCATDCAASCAAAGQAVFASGCEGFCSGGTSADAPCLNDAGCPEGACNGGEPVSHGNICNCTCSGIGDGMPDPAGSALVFGGFAVNVNVGDAANGPDMIPCTADDIPTIILPPVCAPFTTTSGTVTVLNNDNNMIGDQIGPIVSTGTPFVCTDLFTSVTTGGSLTTALAFYDSTLGDLAVTLDATCQ